MVDRWFDSDDWNPWTPPSPEEVERQRSDPDAPRPEIVANEEKCMLEYRQIIQNPTTAHPRSWADSGRDVLDPTPIETTAVVIIDFHSRQFQLTIAANREQFSLRWTMTTRLDGDIYEHSH